MTVKLLTEHLSRFLSIKEGCTCQSESTLVELPHCWKSHVQAHMYFEGENKNNNNWGQSSTLQPVHEIWELIFTLKKLKFHFFRAWYNVYDN